MLALAPLLVVALQGTPAEAIARAHALIDELACSDALALAAEIEADARADQTERREAWMVAGYCLAVGGRMTDAEAKFRAAVVEDVRVEPGFVMERRIQFLLDYVRSDVLNARVERAQQAMKEKRDAIKIEIEPPFKPVGGARAVFKAKVTDPHGLVAGLRFTFRRQFSTDRYELPFSRAGEGAWSLEIPGEFTRTASGVELYWHVGATDLDGKVVASHGSPQAPLTLVVVPGSAVATDLEARRRLPPEARFIFGTVAVPVATAGAYALAAGLSLGIGAAMENFPGPAEPLAFFVSSALGAGLPGVAALLANVSTVPWLLDDARIFVIAGTGIVAAAAATAVVVNDVAGLGANTTGPPKPGDVLLGRLFVHAASAGMLLTLNAAMMPTLIALDAPPDTQ